MDFAVIFVNLELFSYLHNNLKKGYFSPLWLASLLLSGFCCCCCYWLPFGFVYLILNLGPAYRGLEPLNCEANKPLLSIT